MQHTNAAVSPSSSLRRLVSPRLKIRHQTFLIRRTAGTTQGSRGSAPNSTRFQRSLPAASTTIDYTDAYLAPFKAKTGQSEGGMEDDMLHHCPRLIDAELIHGDEQEFWSERRTFRRSGGSRQTFYPTWDRQAQALIMMVERVPRVPAAAAFRLMTLGLRMLLLPRLAGVVSTMLPLQVGMQAVAMGPIQKAAREKENAQAKDQKAGSKPDEKKAASASEGQHSEGKQTDEVKTVSPETEGGKEVK